MSGASIGTFKHLPPILTVKYDFLPHEVLQPYVNLSVPNVGTLKLNSTSVGPALQAGFDYKIADHWYLNANVKWAKLGSDVDLVGVGRVSTVRIDPYLFGFGYRFGG